MAARRASSDPTPSRLQAELARRILKTLQDEGATPGQRLVELDLCRRFGVSRTPVRGALRLLATQGAIVPRANRGFVLTQAAKEVPASESASRDPDEKRTLFAALAQARNTGKLADRFTQQEIVRRFGARLPIVLAVLRQLAELGLVQRRAGNGWGFGPAADAQRAQAESYAFRRALEPAMLLQPGFRLDRFWLEKTRAAHLKFRRRTWRDSDATDFYEVNADFHEQLARCSGNRYMLGAVRQQIVLRRFLSHQLEYDAKRIGAAIDDHLEILAALEGGWNDKAAALMLHHLTISASHAA
ncbi:MAG TPA: GntR family transcriptional regulator [Rhizomicrobium sp.]|jgi:DNA-binding GntR family transcriptional regulator|nr:GntR family transcriptional regulator [Rhizomicrobium sp.]